MSERHIVDMYGFAKTTVHRVIKNFEERGLTAPAPRSGRPPKLSEEDKLHLVEIVENDHLASLSEITAQMRDITLDTISEITIRRALHATGYFGRVGVRKPFISEVNRQKRLNWAIERRSWTMECDYIIWSDESRYVLSGSKRRKWVWRRPEQKMDVECLIPTFKKTQKSVMIWGCFTRFGVGPLVRLRGKQSAKTYVEVLQDHLIPFLAGLKNKRKYIFQEDNAPIHTAKKSKGWKEENKIALLPWPAQSPDLNPIEHIWDALERGLRERKEQPKNEDELFDFLLEEWEKLPLDIMINLVESMPRRVLNVKDANGYPTRY